MNGQTCGGVFASQDGAVEGDVSTGGGTGRELAVVVNDYGAFIGGYGAIYRNAQVFYAEGTRSVGPEGGVDDEVVGDGDVGAVEIELGLVGGIQTHGDASGAVGAFYHEAAFDGGIIGGDRG